MSHDPLSSSSDTHGECSDLTVYEHLPVDDAEKEYINYALQVDKRKAPRKEALQTSIKSSSEEEDEEEEKEEEELEEYEFPECSDIAIYVPPTTDKLDDDGRVKSSHFEDTQIEGMRMKIEALEESVYLMMVKVRTLEENIQSGAHDSYRRSSSGFQRSEYTLRENEYLEAIQLKIFTLEENMKELMNRINTLEESRNDERENKRSTLPIKPKSEHSIYEPKGSEIDANVPLLNENDSDKVDLEKNSPEIINEIRTAKTASSWSILGASHMIHTIPYSESSIYNTGGVYMHAVLCTTSIGTGLLRSWLASIGSFMVTSLQIMLLLMIISESYKKIDSEVENSELGRNAVSWEQVETEICGKLDPRQMIGYLFVSCLFACVLFKDIKHSVIEETVLNVASKKHKVTSPRSVEVIRLCLRLRQYILPWLLTAAATCILIQQGTLSTNEMLLNFLAIGFIIEADKLIGTLMFSESSQKEAEISVIHATRDENTAISFLWPKTLAVIPSIIIASASALLLRLGQCLDVYEFLIFFITEGILSLFILVAYSVTSFVRDNESSTTFERYVHCISQLFVNLLGWSLYEIMVIITFPEPLTGTWRSRWTFIDFAVNFVIFVVLWWCKEYSQRINLEDPTQGNKMFCIFSFLYSLFVVGAGAFFAYFMS